MSDTLSLTLPKLGTRSRARRRRRRPPNWRKLVLYICWDITWLIFAVIVFAVSGEPAPIFTAIGCALDLRLCVRAWRRDGVIPPGDQRLPYAFWIAGIIVMFAT